MDVSIAGQKTCEGDAIRLMPENRPAHAPKDRRRFCKTLPEACFVISLHFSEIGDSAADHADPWRSASAYQIPHRAG